MTAPIASARPRIRAGRVVLYVLLTFGLSWGLMFLEGSLERSGTSYRLSIPPLPMLIPALVAIGLRLFWYRDSPIHVSQYRERPRWILLTFLGLVVLHGSVVLLAASGTGPVPLLRIAGTNLTILWALGVFYFYRRSSEASVKRAGLWIGNNHISIRFLVFIVAFLVVQAALDLVCGLGDLRSRAAGLYGIAIPAPLYVPGLILGFGFFAVVAMPLGGLAVTFGEEYGWRGFLQDELRHMGARPSALLIGLIWGVWHIPILLTGIHTYPPTMAGFAASFAFFTLWGVIQSYVVLKTGGIWPAAFMHGLVNSVYGFIRMYVVRPDDKIFSFGLGIYGIACLGLAVAAIWRDPVWARDRSQRERPRGDREG